MVRYKLRHRHRHPGDCGDVDTQVALEKAKHYTSAASNPTHRSNVWPPGRRGRQALPCGRTFRRRRSASASPTEAVHRQTERGEIRALEGILNGTCDFVLNRYAPGRSLGQLFQCHPKLRARRTANAARAHSGIGRWPRAESNHPKWAVVKSGVEAPTCGFSRANRNQTSTASIGWPGARCNECHKLQVRAGLIPAPFQFEC